MSLLETRDLTAHYRDLQALFGVNTRLEQGDTLESSENKIGVVTPNFTVQQNSFEMFEQRYLPAKDFGVLIVTTNKGIMTHKQAKERRLGGKLLAYAY